MTVQAQTPDGAIHEFPDGTPDSVVDGAIKNYLNPPSLAGDIGKDVRGAIANEANMTTSNMASTALQTMGNIAGGAWDVAGDVAKRIPGYETAKNAVNAAGQWGADKLDPSGSIGEGILDTAQDLQTTHPELAANIAAAGKILPLESTIGVAADIAKSGLNAMSDNAGKTAAEIASAPSAKARPYAEVEQANKALARNTSAAYQKAHELGLTLPADTAQAMISQIRSDVGTLVPKTSPQTASLLKAFEKEAQDGLTLPEIDEYRKQLGRISWNSINPNDVPKAQMAKNAIDSYLGVIQDNPDMATGGNPSSISALGEAHAAHQLESNHSQLVEIARQANGDQNVLQAQMKKLFNNREDYNNYSADDRKIISDIAHPTGLNNMLETIGKVGFRANKSYPAWGDLGSAAVALATGNPLTAAGFGAALATGTAANLTRGAIIRRAFDGLLKGIEDRSVPVRPIGESPLSPINPQKLIPYMPSVNSSGTVVPAQNPSDMMRIMNPVAEAGASDTGVTPGTQTAATQAAVRGSQAYHQGENAAGTSVPPGNTPKLPVPKSQRMAVAGNVYQPVASKPSTPAVDAAKQALSDMAQGKPTSSTPPIKSMGDIAPGMPELAARQRASQAAEAAQKQKEEEQMLMMMQGPRGYKRGGSVPTPAQAEAGNYKKGHVKFQGLDISIETPKGAIRRGNGWENISPADYGYIKGTQGADSEHVDCYIGPHEKSNRVYVVDQHHLHNGKWDEHKCLLGFANRDEAVSCYKAGFSDGKGHKRIREVMRMSVAEFKDWLKNGDTKRPVKHTA